MERAYVSKPLEKSDFPAMGGEVSLPAGDYHLTAFRTDFGEELDERFQQLANPLQRRAWARVARFSSLASLATIVAFFSSALLLLFTSIGGYALLAWPIAALLWLIPPPLKRNDDYRAAEALYRTIENELPSIVLVLKLHA